MNKKYNYNIGDIHNKLEVVELFDKNNRRYAKTKCLDCGREKVLRASDLYNPKQNSCLCNIIKHGLSESRIYATYHNMKDRCYNPKCHAYKLWIQRNNNL